MKIFLPFVSLVMLVAAGSGLRAQPSFAAPPPATAPVEDPAMRRDQYLARRMEALRWRASLATPGDPTKLGLAEIAAKLALREDAEACSAQIVELMKKPSADMFWMFPVTCISYLGRDQLTPAAKAAIREAWRTYYPLRGDTENHWVMYYTTMHLMAQLWPGEGEDRWFNGKTSAEITAESVRGCCTGWNSRPPSGRANTTARTTSGSIRSRCCFSRRGPRIRRCASAAG